MNKNKQLIVNMAAGFISYAISLGISFLLSPYIVKNVGVEAYGFVGLANNFVSYAGLATIALNSLAGRFITIKIYEDDVEGANKYFSSVFIANMIITLFFALASCVIVSFLEKIVSIPSSIVLDVKILFAASFINCMIGTATSVFSIATFSTNKLYIDSLRTIEASSLRVVAIIILFAFFPTRVCYVGITACIMGLYCAFFRVYYTHKLTPFLKIKKKFFDLKAIIELICSGIWNLVIRIGQLLLDGIDLLITNIFISATAMGVLSIAKIIPIAITGVVSTLVDVFSPNFTILYAEKKYDELVSSVKQSMKIMGVLCNIPVIVLIICGKEFFSLWQPTQDAYQLQILSILTCGCIIVSGCVNCLYNIFTVVNKLRINAIIVLCTGVLTAAVVYLLLKLTDLGIYAVAGASTVISVIRNFAFTVPYGAACLKQKWYAFFPMVIRSILFVVISVVIISFIPINVNNSWLILIAKGLLSVAVSALIGMFIMINKNDRKYILSRIRR